MEREESLMPILIILLLIAVFAYMAYARRGSTLTRECRWRQDRSIGPQHWRCASCGAQCESPKASPRHCLRDKTGGA